MSVTVVYSLNGLFVLMMSMFGFSISDYYFYFYYLQVILKMASYFNYFLHTNNML